MNGCKQENKRGEEEKRGQTMKPRFVRSGEGYIPASVVPLPSSSAPCSVLRVSLSSVMMGER